MAGRLQAQLVEQESLIGFAGIRQRIYILVITLVVILALVTIFYFQALRKTERQFSHTLVNKVEEERERIARDLHDGLGQRLVMLKNHFNQQIDAHDPVRELVNNGCNEMLDHVRSISRSLIPPELKGVGLRKAIENIFTDIERTSGVFVTAELNDLDKVMLNEQDELKIYRVIQELTSNTLKHSGATAIRLEASVDTGKLVLTYRDNGSGVHREKWYQADRAMGLYGILQRIKSMNGSVKIEQPVKGLHVVFKIPVNHA